MEIIKECGVCGKEFVASKMSVKYCCRGCERVAFRRREAEKKKREKENAESLRNAERNNFLRDKAFLSPEDVSVLFNDSLPTVYRYFQTGLIKAVKIRNKTFVRYSDIERVFDDATPYRKRRYQRKEEQEYYTLREIMEKYNIGRKAVWGRCDRLGIPKIYEGRNTFFSKKAIDAHFADLLEEIDIDNYYTADQIMEMYNMTRTAVITFVMRHKVPRVNRNGKVFYSKVHIDCIKRKDDSIDPDWSTYEEAMEKYGISKDQVSYTLKHFDVRTEKRGKFTMIFRTDFDKVMRERMANAKVAEKSDGDEKLVFQAQHQEKKCPPTPDGYYSTEEVAEMFKVGVKHVGVMTREHKTPKIALKGFNFYEKKAIDVLYNLKNNYSEITDWITPEEMRSTYKMTAEAVRSFIYRHQIPAKVEYGTTYYSKQHIEQVKNGDFDGRERYYTVEEAMKKYHLSKDIVHYYVKRYKITKVKKKKCIYFRKEEFDRLMEKRLSKDDLLSITLD